MILKYRFKSYLTKKAKTPTQGGLERERGQEPKERVRDMVER
jgi:hypothetical protein